MNKEYNLYGKKISASIIIGVILVVFGFVLVTAVIIPQIRSIGEQREANSLKQSEVAQLESSLAALNSVSDQRVASDIDVLTSALPANKEVISVFSSIISLATDVGVQVRGFTIQVGDIYDINPEQSQEVDVTSDTGFPSMNVMLTLNSTDQRQIVEFTKQLYKNFPISKINTISAQETNSMLEISFYYRPYDLDTLQNTTVIPGYTNESLELLKTLRELKN
ncbi:MAG TPA: hypothetical protein PLD54_03640 [Candidatus Levybacteria bacterium]|nr:hypothetical protein [Candidatus Levybacteria bacterium]